MGSPPPAGSTLQPDAPEVVLQVRDFAYQPRTLTVRVCARVTWTNEDAIVHTATDRAGRWDTGTFGKGASASQKFDAAGVFAYYCTVHPAMTGTVIVRQ